MKQLANIEIGERGKDKQWILITKNMQSNEDKLKKINVSGFLL